VAFLAYVHLALFLALSLSPGNSFVSSWCGSAAAAAATSIAFADSFFDLTVSNSSLFTPALLRTHSFVFFAVHETRRIFLSPFISKASRRVSSFFLRVQLSKPYVATGHTSAVISRIFIEIASLLSCRASSLRGSPVLHTIHHSAWPVLFFLVFSHVALRKRLSGYFAKLLGRIACKAR